MNRREFLKRVGVLSAAVSLVLSNSPSQAADPQPVTVLVTYHSATGNTEKMAQGVAEGAKAVSGTLVVLKRVGDVTENDLVSADAVIVGSPVYFGNMSGEVKTFFDNWSKFGLFRDRKMRNKVGGAFATGASVSSGKEVTMLTIFAAMFINQMIVVSGGEDSAPAHPRGPTRRASMRRNWQKLAIWASALRKSLAWLNGDPASEWRARDPLTRPTGPPARLRRTHPNRGAHAADRARGRLS